MTSEQQVLFAGLGYPQVAVVLLIAVVLVAAGLSCQGVLLLQMCVFVVWMFEQSLPPQVPFAVLFGCPCCRLLAVLLCVQAHVLLLLLWVVLWLLW